jgi:hypothetical protein
MIRIGLGFPSTVGIVIFAASEICEWWVPVDGVVVGVVWVVLQQEIRPGIFQPTTRA